MLERNSSAASNQIAQRLLADHRKHHVAHHAVRMGERSVGQLEQQVLFAGDALEVVQQLALDLALGPRADLVDGLDQQVHQIVGEAAGAQVDEGGQPGEACRIGMPAQFVRRFDRHAAPAALQIAWCGVVEQIGRQLDPPDETQLGQLVLHTGEAGPAGAAAQLQ